MSRITLEIMIQYKAYDNWTFSFRTTILNLAARQLRAMENTEDAFELARQLRAMENTEDAFEFNLKLS
jgi:hypothetical protein